MKSKTKVLVLLGIFIVIGGIFLTYKNNQEKIKNKCTTYNTQDHNLSYIHYCIETGKVYPQEQYDLYYNVAKNNPPLSIVQDDIFYQGFDLANKNCGIDSRPNAVSCNSHDKKVMKDFMEKCTANAKTPSVCTSSYFHISIPNKENINYFTNTIQLQIKENKENNNFHVSNCYGIYKKFYKKIDKELIKEIPEDVKIACEEK